MPHEFIIASFMVVVKIRKGEMGGKWGSWEENEVGKQKKNAFA